MRELAEDPLDLARADVNRRYFVHYVLEKQETIGPLRVLDFGCGSGEVLRLLRQQGVECFGTDVFYEGTTTHDIPAVHRLLETQVIRRIPEGGRLPFQDGWFDLIISDQVFEHVEDTETTVRELDRILKDEGTMLHHFPSKDVLREGHIHIPLAHRLPPNLLRFGYTLLLRTLGFGNHKSGRTRRDWTRWKLDWIDRYCFYRTRTEIEAIFATNHVITHREFEYCRFRAGGRPLISQLLRMNALRPPCESIFRGLAFMCIELEKRNKNRPPTLGAVVRQ
jgi:SAM-dependent methyltransferase